MAEILILPGVARKTANVVLGNAYNVVDGIAVDTHMIRINQKLGFTRQKDPVKIERDLMQIIPKNEWFSYTYRIINYGRAVCTARHKNVSANFIKLNKKGINGRNGMKGVVFLFLCFLLLDFSISAEAGKVGDIKKESRQKFRFFYLKTGKLKCNR